jgi:hypothetical protein
MLYWSPRGDRIQAPRLGPRGYIPIGTRSAPAVRVLFARPSLALPSGVSVEVHRSYHVRLERFGHVGEKMRVLVARGDRMQAPRLGPRGYIPTGTRSAPAVRVLFARPCLALPSWCVERSF